MESAVPNGLDSVIARHFRAALVNDLGDGEPVDGHDFLESSAFAQNMERMVEATKPRASAPLRSSAGLCGECHTAEVIKDPAIAAKIREQKRSIMTLVSSVLLVFDGIEYMRFQYLETSPPTKRPFVVTFSDDQINRTWSGGRARL